MTELGGHSIADIELRLKWLRGHSGQKTWEAVGLAELLLTEVHRLRLAQARADADRLSSDQP